MSQTFNKGYLGTRQKPAIEEEFYIPMPKIVGVAGRVITLEAHALYDMGITENMLAGQEIRMLENDAGNSLLAGYTFRVESNTSVAAGADSITLEAEVQGTDIWDALPAAMAATDRFVCSTRGISPDKIDTTALDFNNANGLWENAVPTTGPVQHTVDELWAAIDSCQLPDPNHSVEEMWAHGSVNMPLRHLAIHNQITYETSWPLTCLMGKRLLGIFGEVVDNASKFDVSTTTLSNDVYPGEYVLQVAAEAGFLVGDYVEIGDHGDVELAGADSEIRKVVQLGGGAGNKYLILDAPVRRFHAATDDVSEVDSDCYDMTFATGEYIQHTLTVGHSVPTYTIGVNKRGEQDDVNVEDFYLTYVGHVFTGGTFRSSLDTALKVDIPSKGLYAERDPDFWDSDLGGGADYVAISPPNLDTSYFYSGGNAIGAIHFSDSYLKFGGVQWHQNEDIEISITRDMETRYAHSRVRKSLPGVVGNSRRDTDGDGLIFGRNPYGHFPGRVSVTASQVIPLHNKELWDVIRERGALEVEVGFQYVRSATFTESWVFTIPDMVLEAGGTELPSNPQENQTLTGPPEGATLVIKDRVHYY